MVSDVFRRFGRVNIDKQHLPAHRGKTHGTGGRDPVLGPRNLRFRDRPSHRHGRALYPSRVKSGVLRGREESRPDLLGFPCRKVFGSRIGGREPSLVFSTYQFTLRIEFLP